MYICSQFNFTHENVNASKNLHTEKILKKMVCGSLIFIYFIFSLYFTKTANLLCTKPKVQFPYYYCIISLIVYIISNFYISWFHQIREKKG